MARRVEPVRKSVKQVHDDLIEGHAAASLSGPASAIKYLDRVLAGQANLPMAVRTVVWDPLESTCRHASLSIL